MPVVYCNDCGESITVAVRHADRRWALCKRCGCEVNVTPASAAVASVTLQKRKLKSQRVGARPSLHASIHPPLLDPAIVSGIEDPKCRVEETARWVKPVYWIRFEPVGIKGAAQATVRVWPSIKSLSKVRLGEFRHPKASYPTSLAFALSLRSARVELLPHNEPEVIGPTRRVERRAAALKEMRREAAQSRQFAAADPILELEFNDDLKCGRELRISISSKQAAMLVEQNNCWRLNLSDRRGFEPKKVWTRNYTDFAMDLWWHAGPRVSGTPRRRDW